MALKLADIYVEATLNADKLNNSLVSTRQNISKSTNSIQQVVNAGTKNVSNSFNGASKGTDGFKKSMDTVQQGVNPLSGGLHQMVGAMTALGISSNQSAGFMKVLAGIAAIDMVKGISETTKGIWASVVALGAYSTAANSAAVGSLLLNTQVGIGGLLGSIKITSGGFNGFIKTIMSTIAAFNFSIIKVTALRLALLGLSTGILTIFGPLAALQSLLAAGLAFGPTVARFKGGFEIIKIIANSAFLYIKAGFMNLFDFAKHVGSTFYSVFATVGKAALSLLFNPLGLAIAAIVAALAILGYAFYKIYKAKEDQDALTKSTAEYAKAVKESTDALKDLQKAQELTKIGSFGKSSAAQENAENQKALEISKNKLKFFDDMIIDQKKAIENGQVDAQIGATQLTQMQRQFTTANELNKANQAKADASEKALAIEERTKAIYDAQLMSIKNQLNFKTQMFTAQGKTFDASMQGLANEQSTWTEDLNKRAEIAKLSGDTVLKERIDQERTYGTEAFSLRAAALETQRKDDITSYIALEEEKVMITLATERDKLLLNAKSTTETMNIWRQFYIKRDRIADETNKKRAEMETSLSLDTIKNEIEQQKQVSINQLNIWFKENEEYARKNGLKIKLDEAYAARKEKIELDTAQKVYEVWAKKETEFTNRKIAGLGMIKQGVMTNLISPEEQKKSDARAWKQDLVNSLKDTPGGAEIYERYRKQIDAVYSSMSKSKVTAGQFTDVASNWKDTQSKILSGKNYEQENLNALRGLEEELKKANIALKAIEKNKPGIQN